MRFAPGKTVDCPSEAVVNSGIGRFGSRRVGENSQRGIILDDRKAIYPLTACVLCMFADAAREGHAEVKFFALLRGLTARKDAAREGHAEVKPLIRLGGVRRLWMQPARVTLR